MWPLSAPEFNWIVHYSRTSKVSDYKVKEGKHCSIEKEEGVGVMSKQRSIRGKGRTKVHQQVIPAIRRVRRLMVNTGNFGTLTLLHQGFWRTKTILPVAPFTSRFPAAVWGCGGLGVNLCEHTATSVLDTTKKLEITFGVLTSEGSSSIWLWFPELDVR